MRIRNDSRRPVRHDEPGQLRGRQQGAFQVHVSIDESGQHYPVSEVQGLPGRPIVRSDTGDPAIGKDHVRRLHPLREHIDDLAAGQQ